MAPALGDGVGGAAVGLELCKESVHGRAPSWDHGAMRGGEGEENPGQNPRLSGGRDWELDKPDRYPAEGSTTMNILKKAIIPVALFRPGLLLPRRVASEEEA